MDYSEILLEAVDILVKDRLDKISFDKTVKCEIIDDTSKSEGKYIVIENNAKMEAYCETADKYSVGDFVYVMIPQGDYTKKKIIISKYTDDNSRNPIAYVPPLSTVIDTSGNIITTTPTDNGILANGNIEHKLLYDIDLTLNDKNGMPIYGISPQETKEYDAIGISADFATRLEDKAIQTGAYGLRIDISEYLNKDGQETYDNPISYTFSSEEMFGNPYNFVLPLRQSMKINKGDKFIHRIKVYLFQDKKFQYRDELTGELVPYPHALPDGTLKKDNIHVSNISINFGADLKNLADDTFKIYTTDETSYDNNHSAKRTIRTLWTNKDDKTHEFIGFYNGVVDEDYDEEEYLREYETNYRGAQVTIREEDKGILESKEGLQIYHNAQMITQELLRINNYLGEDFLDTYFQSLQRNFNGFGVDTLTIKNDTPSVEDDTLITIEDYINSLIQLRNNLVWSRLIEPSEQVLHYMGLEQMYISTLKACATEFAKAKEENKDVDLSECNFDLKYWNGDDSEENNSNDKGLESELETYLSHDYFNLTNIYTQYPDTRAYCEKMQNIFSQIKTKIEKSIEIIQDYIEKSNGLMNAIKQSGYKVIPFREEYETFIQENANRYCIYWYRYNKGYENAEDNFIQKDWQRITFPSGAVPGMPSIFTENAEVDPPIRKYEKHSKTTYSVTLNTKVKEEKFKAILFFNHGRFNSNELVFENTSVLASDIDGDLTGALYIQVGKIGDETTGTWMSMASHQLYNSYFTLINSADAKMNRQIRIRYDGTLGKDEVLAGAQVFWYVPIQATMLKYDENKLITSNGFSRLPLKEELLEKKDAQGNTEYDKNGEPVLIEPEDYTNHHRDGYVCFYKNIAGIQNNDKVNVNVTDTYFWYQISHIYNTSFTNNEIICKIVKNGFTSEARFQFSFGIYGSNGTDYTLSINYIDNQSAVIYEKPLKLKGDFTDYNGQSLETIFSWEWYGPHLINWPKDANGEPNSSYVGQTIDLSVDNAGLPSCLYNVIKVTTQWGTLNAEDKSDEILTLSSVQSIPWASDNYYVAGADRIIYNDLGTSPQYYNSPYKIYKVSDNSEITNVRWEMRYYNHKGNLIEVDEKTLVPRIVKKGKANDTELDYCLSPLNLYVTDQVDTTKIYSVAVCIEQIEENGQLIDGSIIYALPIYIGQNQHGSSLLNRWDESLQIDSENNTILTAMVGAGYKDSENRFHGILMGDVVTKVEDDSLTMTGLYGFHEGVQSFGWKADGTAFIGKAGRGRIEFDGTNGIIKSASYMVDGSDNHTGGTLIDLDDGSITLRGVKASATDGTISYFKDDGVQSLIKLNTVNPYLIINSTIGKTLMMISDADMYVQSNNYNSTDGMKIDLNSGLIDAYNFKLTSAGIYLNSNKSDNDYYFYLGDKNSTDSNKSYISYSHSGTLSANLQNITLSTSDFHLNAGNWQDGLIILDSNGYNYTKPESDQEFLNYYFAIGNSHNHLIFDTNGLFKLQTANINLNTPNLKINSAPDLLNNNSYFYIGNKTPPQNETEHNNRNYLHFFINDENQPDFMMNLGGLKYYNRKLTVPGASVTGVLESAIIRIASGGSTVFEANAPAGTVQIAGWIVDNNCFKNTSETIFFASSGRRGTFNGTVHNNVILQISDGFMVNAHGELYCHGGTFEGTVYADEATIGGWTVKNGTMSAESLTLSADGIKFDAVSGNVGWDELIGAITTFNENFAKTYINETIYVSGEGTLPNGKWDTCIYEISLRGGMVEAIYIIEDEGGDNLESPQ